MIHSRRFFGKRLKRALLSANRTRYSYNLSPESAQCPECYGSGIGKDSRLETCQSCNGSGIVSSTEISKLEPAILLSYQVVPSIESLANNFDEMAILINQRFSNLVALYRDW